MSFAGRQVGAMNPPVSAPVGILSTLRRPLLLGSSRRRFYVVHARHCIGVVPASWDKVREPAFFGLERRTDSFPWVRKTHGFAPSDSQNARARPFGLAKCTKCINAFRAFQDVTYENRQSIEKCGIT